MDNLKGRIRLYEILASAFYPPSAERKAEIMDGRLGRRIAQVIEQCCEISARCCLSPDLLEEIRELSSAPKEAREQAEFRDGLDAEYVRLFVNDFPVLCAPPYESFYQEGRVMGKAAVDCRSIYAADGLALQEKGELPDHIVSQLEYLLFVCLGEARAAEEGDAALCSMLRERARSFYTHHVMTWVPEFCTRIRTQSSVPYYKVMAKLLKKFTAMESRNLNQEKLDTVRGGSAQ